MHKTTMFSRRSKTLTKNARKSSLKSHQGKYIVSVLVKILAERYNSGAKVESKQDCINGAMKYYMKDETEELDDDQ